MTIVSLGALLLVVGAASYLRFRDLGGRNPGIGDDRSQYVLFAVGFHDTGGNPWRHLPGSTRLHGVYNWFHKPLVDPAGALGCLLFGAERGAYAMVGVAGVLLVVVLYALASTLGGRLTGLAAAALASTSAIQIAYSSTPWSNIYGALFLALGVLSHIFAERSAKMRYRFLAGLAYSASILADDAGIVLVPILIALEFLFWLGDLRRRAGLHRIRKVAYLYLGAASLMLLAEGGAVSGKLFVSDYEGGSYLMGFRHRKVAAVDSHEGRFALGEGARKVWADVVAWTGMLREWETWPVVGLAAVGIAASVLSLAGKDRRTHLLLLALFAGHRVATAFFAANVARVTVPIHPLFLLFAALGVGVLARGIGLALRRPRLGAGLVALALATLALLLGLENRAFLQTNGGLAKVRDALRDRGIDRVSVGEGALCAWPVASDVAMGVPDHRGMKGTFAAQVSHGFEYRLSFDAVLPLPAEDFLVSEIEPVAVLDHFPMPPSVPIEEYPTIDWSPGSFTGSPARIEKRPLYLYHLAPHLRPDRPERPFEDLLFDLSIGRFHWFRATSPK